jgi:peptidoglycan hydrolase CwlO-like protein
LTRAATVAAPRQRSEPAMQDDIWNDDESWWHQQDLEMQQLEEQQRIEICNQAIAELNAFINEHNALINEQLRKINAK